MTRKGAAPERGFLSGAALLCQKSSPAAIFSARFAPSTYSAFGSAGRQTA